MTRSGYPACFVSKLGLWKVLGGFGVLAPRLPGLKQWAYAGMLFDFTGAAVSHAARGVPAGKIVAPAYHLGLVTAS
jgi:DoxX-like family